MMMPEFKYRELREMPPRPGVTFRTYYFKQSDQQRQELVNWFQGKISEIESLIDNDWRLQEAQHWPLRGFNKTNGQQNRSLAELLEDQVGEILKVQKNWGHNDFAEAPINRWNRFFRGSEWEFRMIEAQSHAAANQFQQLFKQGN